MATNPKETEIGIDAMIDEMLEMSETERAERVEKSYDHMSPAQRHEVDRATSELCDAIISQMLEKGSIDQFIEQRRPAGPIAEIMRVYRELAERDGMHGNVYPVRNMFRQVLLSRVAAKKAHEEKAVNHFEFDASTEIDTVLKINRNIDESAKQCVDQVELGTDNLMERVGYNYHAMIRLISGLVITDGDIRQGEAPVDIENPPAQLLDDNKHGVVSVTDKRLFDLAHARMIDDNGEDRTAGVKIRRQQPLHIFYRVNDDDCEGMIIQGLEKQCNLAVHFNLWNEDMADEEDLESMLRWIIAPAIAEQSEAIATTETIADIDALSRLRRELADPKRSQSVLVMTRRGDDWLIPPADLERAAEGKRPRAHLVEAEMERELRAMLGQSAPQDGAARLYHPGCRIHKAHHNRHRLFVGDKGAAQLRQALGISAVAVAKGSVTAQAQLARTDGKASTAEPARGPTVAAMPAVEASKDAAAEKAVTSTPDMIEDDHSIARNSDQPVSQDGPETSDISSAEHEAVAAAEQRSRDAEERATHAEAERQRLEATIASLHEGYGIEIQETIELLKVAEDERDKARRRARRAENEIETLRAENKTLRSVQPGDNDLKPDGWPTDMAGIAEWANSRFADRLIIHPRAERALRKASYGDVDRAARTVEMLATDYHDAKNGIAGAYERMTATLAELRLVDDRQVQAGGPEAAQYWIEHDKRRLFLGRHIKGKESGKRDRRVFRVYYVYDEVGEKVVIGWMPDHLTTTAS